METLHTILEGVIAEVGLDTEGQEAAQVRRGFMREMNLLDNRRRVSLPGEGDLGFLDIGRPVEAEDVNHIRDIASRLAKEVLSQRMPIDRLL